MINKSDDDYIGSEQHYQDIINGSWDAREANGQPAETLGEASYRFCKAVNQLWRALGIPAFADRCLVIIGKIIAWCRHD